VSGIVTFEKVARIEDVPEEGLMGAMLPNGERICLVRSRHGLFAVEDRCSHEAYPLSAGELLPDGTLECIWHGARFDPATGAPCAGPAYTSLATYEVRLADGDVLVAPVPSTTSDLIS